MSEQVLSIPSLLTAFERHYRGDHKREHALLLDASGDVVSQNTGDYDSVHFKDSDLEQARGGYVSHTHPRALPPSGADLALSARYSITLRAVGNAPDSGRQYNYTVANLTPSLADAISATYDDAVEQAEKQLARLPIGDLQWQREARHLALTRLSKRYGFTYQRVQRGALLSEASVREQKRLKVLSAVDPILRDSVLLPLHAQLLQVLARYADNSGVIPMANLAAVRTAVDALVQRTMLGTPLHDGTLLPLQMTGGHLVARSVYARALLALMRQAESEAVAYHAALMRKYLPEDLRQMYEYASVAPSGITPLQDVTAPNDRRLNDSIWLAAGELARRLGGFLTTQLAQMTPLQAIGERLKEFLLGGKGSYELFRLARTNTARAYARTDFASAQLNPFVESFSVMTSPRHQCSDECDIEEAGSPYAANDFEHMPPFHVNCMCTVIWNAVSDIAGAVKALREHLAEALSKGVASLLDMIGPLSRRFLAFLFGERQ